MVFGSAKMFVPSVACDVGDVVHVVEDGIGQPVGGEQLPDVFDRV